MQHVVTVMIEHMSRSHEQMVRVLEAKRHVAVRMSQMVDALPSEYPDFDGMGGLMKSSQAVTSNVVAYLNSLAEFQESLAVSVGVVMREMDSGEQEED